MSWAAELGNCIRIRIGKKIAASDLCIIIPEENLQIFQFKNEESTNKKKNSIVPFNQSNSIAVQSLPRFNERSSTSVHCVTEETKSVQTMTDDNIDIINKSSTNILKCMMTESLNGVYRKLEEIEQSNQTQFRKIIENNKETDNRVKELKEAMKIQHLGMRRRFESLEKKTNS